MTEEGSGRKLLEGREKKLYEKEGTKIMREEGSERQSLEGREMKLCKRRKERKL